MLPPTAMGQISRVNRIKLYWLCYKLYKEVRKVLKLKNWFQAIQWVNVVGIAGQIVNVLPTSKYVLIAQALIGIILPSLGGVAHQVAYSEPQNPAKR